jgi:hypothetical protein
VALLGSGATSCRGCFHCRSHWFMSIMLHNIRLPNLAGFCVWRGQRTHSRRKRRGAARCCVGPPWSRVCSEEAEESRANNRAQGSRMGCLRTLLIARTKLKLFKAQRMRGGASSEVLRRLECAFAGALIDYLITSISARSTSDRSSHHVAELQSYSKQQPGVEQATPLCCITAPPP